MPCLSPYPCSHPPSLVVVLRVQDPQDGKEEVDDVQVQRDGRCDLLLDVVVAHDQLRVHQDVAGEDQGGDHSVAELHGRRLGEEGRHEAEQNQHPQRSEEVRHPARKVVLGLARKQAQRHEDAQCEYDRLQHNVAIREGDDDRDRVGLHGSEPGEEQEVGGIRFALPEGEAQEDKGADERHPHGPLVRLDPRLVRCRHHRESTEKRCTEKLNSPVLSACKQQVWGASDLQDSIHLADESHANVQRRLGHDASKLEIIGQVVVLAPGNPRNQRLAGWVGFLVARWRLRIRGLVERVSLRHVGVLGSGHVEYVRRAALAMAVDKGCVVARL